MFIEGVARVELLQRPARGQRHLPDACAGGRPAADGDGRRVRQPVPGGDRGHCAGGDAAEGQEQAECRRTLTGHRRTRLGQVEGDLCQDALPRPQSTAHP